MRNGYAKVSAVYVKINTGKPANFACQPVMTSFLKLKNFEQ